MNKKEIIQHISAKLMADYKVLAEELKSISADSGDNQKNSSGDKHETTKAMADMEAEKLSQSLDRLQAQRQFLQHPDILNKKNSIGLFSAFKSNGQGYFILMAFGKIKRQNESIYVVSPDAPLAHALKDLKVGDIGTFNGQAFPIEWIG